MLTKFHILRYLKVTDWRKRKSDITRQTKYATLHFSFHLYNIMDNRPIVAIRNFFQMHNTFFNSKEISLEMNGTSQLADHAYKVLVIGDLGTGKTSIVKRYVHKFFSDNYQSTIGLDFALKLVTLEDGRLVRLQLWDIAGQERFGEMAKVYYRDAVGAFIVFDVTKSATFDNVIKWKNDLDECTALPNGKNIPCVLLANKCDVPTELKQGIVHNHILMDQFCRENRLITWFETSAKDNINLKEACDTLVEQILENEKLYERPIEDSIKLHHSVQEYNKKLECCV